MFIGRIFRTMYSTCIAGSTRPTPSPGPSPSTWAGTWPTRVSWQGRIFFTSLFFFKIEFFQCSRPGGREEICDILPVGGLHTFLSGEPPLLTLFDHFKSPYIPQIRLLLWSFKIQFITQLKVLINREILLCLSSCALSHNSDYFSFRESFNIPV